MRGVNCGGSYYFGGDIKKISHYIHGKITILPTKSTIKSVKMYFHEGNRLFKTQFSSLTSSSAYLSMYLAS